MSENRSVAAVDALLAHLTAERPIMADEHYGIETRQEMLAHLASFSAYLDSYDEWWESAVARIKIKIFYGWRPNLRDEGDNYLVELAIAGGAEAIVTYNIRHFRLGDLRWTNMAVLTPPECLETLK